MLLTQGTLPLRISVSQSAKRRKLDYRTAKGPFVSQLCLCATWQYCLLACVGVWIMSHPSFALPCPGVCMGSSTRHIVTFDGQNFKLTGSCSYVLFQNKDQDLEVILHNGACSPGARQACMKSIEVKHDGLSVELHSDMEVRGAFCGSPGKIAAETWKYLGLTQNGWLQNSTGKLQNWFK